ncbi:MAG: DUF2341 domain-containing protein [Kiritimatiellae bacterium]|nr:DUF2341 domain-containing protein [Kiritimatiellia bacterium]
MTLALTSFAGAGTLDTTKFGKYVEFTVSGYAGGNTAIANLPVLVRLSAANVGGLDYNDIGSTAAEASAVLRFADSNGDNLDYEIEAWNPSGESLIWVSVPTISGTTTKFSAYFEPEDGYILPTVTSTAVWTKAGYIGVWHLDAKNDNDEYEDSSGVSGAVGLAESNKSYPNPTAVTAYGVGNYLASNTAGLFLPATATANWDFGDSGLTFETWALPGGDWEQMFSNTNVLTQKTSGHFMICIAQNKIRWCYEGEGWQNKCTHIDWSTYSSEWRHVAVTYKASSSSLQGGTYVGRQDGKTFGLTKHGSNNAPTREKNFVFPHGCWLMRSAGNTILGVDEIRIRAAETTGEWAKANYMTQLASGFLTYSAVKVAGAKIAATGISASNVSYSTATVTGTFTVDTSVEEDVSVSLVVVPVGSMAYSVNNAATISTASTTATVSLDDLLPGTAYAANFTLTYDGKTISSASAAFTTTALPVPTLSNVGETSATFSGAFSLSGASYTAGTTNAVFTDILTGSTVSAPVANLASPSATATTLTRDRDYKVRLVFARSDGTTVQTRTVLCSTTGTTALNVQDYRHSLAFTASGYAGSTTLVNFPVLVRLSTAIDQFDYSTVNAADIRFADESGTLLAHDVERWEPSGTSLIWVSLPSLSGQTTKFTMYWSPKAGVTVPAARAPQRVWTLAGYAAVWHFSEQNADGSYPDASGYGATAVRFGGAATPNAPTTTGTSANDSPWHVVNSYLKVDAANTEDWYFSETGYTVETWIKPLPAANSEWQRMFVWGGNNSSGNAFAIDRTKVYQAAGDLNHVKEWPNGVAGQDVWRLFTATWENSAKTFSNHNVGCFCNGATQFLKYENAPAVDFVENGMGLTGTLAPNGLLNFPIDEVRIRRGETSADWMDANYATQVTGSTFLTVGSVETRPLGVRFLVY